MNRTLEKIEAEIKKFDYDTKKELKRIRKNASGKPSISLEEFEKIDVSQWER